MQRVEMPLGRFTLSIETGRMAKQADGAVLVRLGDTVVLATACAPPSASGPKTAADLPKVEVPDLELRALLLLVDRQSIDSFVVQQALKGDAALREELAASLGRIPDPEGRGALEGLLIDDVPAVRRAAI